MKNQIAFLLTGLVMGLICATPGVSLFMLYTLTWSVGPAFFIAVIAGIAITGAGHYLQVGVARYCVGLVVCFITYIVALIVFFGVYGFSPDLFDLQPSNSVEQFGFDVWLALIAAGAVAAVGIALFCWLLIGRWSGLLPLRLMLAGLVTIVVTFIVNRPFHGYWSFFGVLLPVGSALFCYLVGTQIWEHLKRWPEPAVLSRSTETAAG